MIDGQTSSWWSGLGIVPWMLALSTVGCGNGSSSSAETFQTSAGGATSGADSDGSASTTETIAPTEACAAYLECVTATTPAELGPLLESYGPTGTCWASNQAVADQCDEACVNALAQIQQNADFVGDPACGEDGAADEDTGNVMPSFADDIRPILNERCVPMCHSPGGEWASLDMSSAPYLNLVGVTADQNVLMNYVEPGDPEQSYLWHKTNGTNFDVGGSGLSMPKAGPGMRWMPLSSEELALIEAWILSGAANN